MQRLRDDQDRRLEHLSLTAQGQAAYIDLSAVARRYEAALTADLEPAETAVLRKALVKLAQTEVRSFDRP